MARPTLFGHRKLVKLGRLIGSEPLAIGHLELLWHAAGESGDPILGDAADVEGLAKWSGEPGQLVKALLECGSAGGAGFLELRDDDRYEVHDFFHHAPSFVGERRAREQERGRPKCCEFCDRTYFSSDVRSKYCSRACRQGKYRQVHDQGAVTDRDGEASRGHNTSRSETLDSLFHDPLRDGRRDGLPSRLDPLEAAPINGSDGRVTDGCDGVTDRYDSPSTPQPTPKDPKEETRRRFASELHENIIAVYHEVLPDLPGVKVWNDRRRKKLDSRIRETLKRGKRADRIEWWKKFFEHVAGSDFLCGRSKTDFRCPGLEWLLEPRNFEKVIEGAYTNHARSNGVRR